MSKEKLLSFTPKSAHGKRLQQCLLSYHEYRHQFLQHPLGDWLSAITAWQSQRLVQTHADLYHDPKYRPALDFLFNDLYAPKDFAERDADLERIYPKLVKYLPDSALGTVANLIEMNILTLQLDEHLALQLSQLGGTPDQLNEAHYAEAYRKCDNRQARVHQMDLILQTGIQLERYVHSRFLSFTLSITEGPADAAGLAALHRFIQRGFSAFRKMGSVDDLLREVIDRERRIMLALFNGAESPFSLTSNRASGRPVPVS